MLVITRRVEEDNLYCITGPGTAGKIEGARTTPSETIHAI